MAAGSLAGLATLAGVLADSVASEVGAAAATSF
jgi:hypothetical protein